MYREICDKTESHRERPFRPKTSRKINFYDCLPVRKMYSKNHRRTISTEQRNLWADRRKSLARY